MAEDLDGDTNGVAIVIEAPGKISLMKSCLADLGLSAKVVATKGHLFSFPSKLDDLGLSKDCREIARQPIDQDRIDWFYRGVEGARTVIVATDADQEGDVIAWDVACLLSQTDAVVVRARLTSITPDGLRAALKATSPVRMEDAVPGRTRAIVDRIIGAAFARKGIGAGRVSAALLGIAAHNQGASNTLKLVAPDAEGGRPWSASFSIQSPLDNALATKLATFALPGLRKLSSASFNEGGLVPHTGDQLVHISERLRVSPKRAADTMQRLYETGRMSYPRAKTRGLSPTTAAAVAESMEGAPPRMHTARMARPKPGDTHEAPHPIGKVDLKANPEKLDLAEGIRIEVGRLIAKAGIELQKERADSRELVRPLLQAGISEEVVRAIAGGAWTRLVGPRLPGDTAWPQSEIVKRRDDAVLLELAVLEDVGRPSTWGDHIERFMKRGLTGQGLGLTAKGAALYKSLPPAMLDPSLSRGIEAACEEAKELRPVTGIPVWEAAAQEIVANLPEEVRSAVEALLSTAAEYAGPAAEMPTPPKKGPSLRRSAQRLSMAPRQ